MCVEIIEGELSEVKNKIEKIGKSLRGPAKRSPFFYNRCRFTPTKSADEHK